MAIKYLDSGALDPVINPIYEAETTPTSGVSAGITTTQPSVGSIVLDTPQNICDQKWAIYSASMTFKTQEAYMLAYNAYISKCLNIGVSPVTTPTVGTSVISPTLNEEITPIQTITTPTPTTSITPTTSVIGEPEIVTPIKDTTSGTSVGNMIRPNLGGFLGSLTGGGAGGGGGATEEEIVMQNKKPFPYWIIAVAVVGGYLIFRKK